MGLWRPLRKTLYKHNVLGGFLEARNRKSAFPTKKVGNFAPKPDFREKSVFRSKSWNFAKRRKTTRNATFFALKSCSRLIQIPLVSANFPNGWIYWNPLNFRKFLKIWWNSRNFAEFLPFCEKTRFGRKWPKIPPISLYNSNVLERGRQTVSVFAEFAKFLKIRKIP